MKRRWHLHTIRLQTRELFIDLYTVLLNKSLNMSIHSHSTPYSRTSYFERSTSSIILFIFFSSVHAFEDMYLLKIFHLYLYLKRVEMVGISGHLNHLDKQQKTIWKLSILLWYLSFSNSSNNIYEIGWQSNVMTSGWLVSFSDVPCSGISAITRICYFFKYMIWITAKFYRY